MASHSKFQPSSANDSSNTTFVQVDPSNFRSVVQRLTGAPPDPYARKLLVNVPVRQHGKPTLDAPRFKLQERRQSTKSLEIKLGSGLPMSQATMRFPVEVVMASPVSPLDLLGPQSPAEEEDEEDRAIAKKGFYLHPFPLNTPRSSEPELLPLFPLHSPRDYPSSSSF